METDGYAGRIYFEYALAILTAIGRGGAEKKHATLSAELKALELLLAQKEAQWNAIKASFGRS
jgi:hypothetical protein